MYSGMDELEFFQYFGSRKTGFAIKVKAVNPYDLPIDPKEVVPNFTPPCSFRYLKGTLFD